MPARSRAALAGLALASSIAVACAPVPELATSGQPLDADNGTWMNGTWMNGSALNGTWMNGTWMNGTWMNGAVLDDVAIRDVRLDGGMLVGTHRGAPLSGEGFENARLWGSDDAGAAVKLRIADVIPPSGSADVWSYRLEWRAPDKSWLPICGGGAAAVAVSGRWHALTAAKVDDGAITFACRGASAIAKCVDMGYRPWQVVAGGSLDGHHQACVRMVRADVCGDGIAYTTDGRAINVYDALGVQVRADDDDLLRATEWAFEGEWTTAGARCISVDARDRFLAAGVVPSCLLARTDLLCGWWWRPGTLVMNEVRALELHVGPLF